MLHIILHIYAFVNPFSEYFSKIHNFFRPNNAYLCIIRIFT